MHKKIVLYIFMIYLANILRVNCAWAQEQKPAPEAGGFLRDPFIAMVSEGQLNQPEQIGPSLEQLLLPMTLKGVMVRDGKSVAIINEEIVVEGQIWHNLKVGRIDKESVTLSYEGKSMRLAMKEEK